MASRQFHGVVWTRISGSPLKMADLVLTESEISFTYIDEFIDSGLPGLSLLTDPKFWGRESIVYPVSELIPVHPRLMSLVPGRNPRNLQRKHYLNLLRQQIGREPQKGIEMEWQLLMLGGHGGIGHVDVFTDDLIAQQWYSQSKEERSPVAAKQSPIWKMIKREVRDQNIDFDAHEIDLQLGPTPSVGGMISKLLVGVDLDKIDKHDELVLTRPGTADTWDVVLKIEAPEYQGLLDLEALCLDMHREAGFESVPQYRRYDNGDLRFLAVERFDQAGKRPLPMESLFSVIASADHNVRSMSDLMLEDLPSVFDQLSTLVAIEANTKEEFYRRIIMALLTGNGDLHLENLSLLGGIDGCALSPVYDPAPMRAWPRHNLVSAISFDPEPYPSRGEFFLELAKGLGMSDKQGRSTVSDLLDGTSGYTSRVMELESAPLLQREQLCRIVKKERKIMEKCISGT